MRISIPPALLLLAFATGANAEDFFVDHVEPLLESRCYSCHSHESGKMKGGLTLDSRAGWEEGGDSGPAVVAGDPDKSLLLRMIHWADADHQMPPKEKLPDHEIAVLAEWIARGAPDPRTATLGPPVDADWWSLRPLVRPEIPGAAGDSEDHPIDRFIRSRLEETGLHPAPEADPVTLLRRVSINLTGLPPAPGEVEEFLRNEDSSGAYEAVVDRLLASPRHGERWARHWFDTIHFADTHGCEHDVHRPNAWRFRDYVIGAFNEDLPWDRFIREQLAVDVFYPGEPQRTPALGFLGAGPFDASAEGTAQAAFEYTDRDDLVTQTITAFASTTASCARCHTHKFDPITQEDYFSLQAVFAGVGKGDLPYDEDLRVAELRRKWIGVKDAGGAHGAMQAEVLLSPENKAHLTDWEQGGGGREQWEVLLPETMTSAGGSVLTLQPDGSVLASGPLPKTDTYTLSFPPEARSVTALKLELLLDPSLPMQGPGRAENGNTHISSFEVMVYRTGADEPENVVFSKATADFEQAEYGVAGLLDPDAGNSWAIHPEVTKEHHAVLCPDKPLVLAAGDRLVILLKQLQVESHLVGKLRVSASSSANELILALGAAARAALEVPGGQRSRDQELALAANVLQHLAVAELARLPAKASVYAASAANQAARGNLLNAAQPRVIHVLKRGDLDKPGAEVGAGALSAVQALPARFDLADPGDEASRRAALADWLAHPDNPLVWRSAVNRVWHHHFGKGICDTPGDFGRMGGIPSHPELLDWLAVWFRDDAKGSVKSLHRLIVTSAAYRQSSRPREIFPDAGKRTAAHPDPLAIDPDNRLLWRMNRNRLDADTYRDAVLAASGRLDLTMGGPGIPHYNASPGPQSTPVLDYAGFDWESAGATRRSIYRVVYRGIADPFMDALDFPDMGMLSPSRGFSASPLQSLTLLNNPFVLGQCQHLASRVQAAAPGVREQVEAMFRQTLLRLPSADELDECAVLVERAGLPALARVLFNTNEFLFVD